MHIILMTTITDDIFVVLRLFATKNSRTTNTSSNHPKSLKSKD